MNAIKFARKLALPLFVALAYVPAQALAAPILSPTLESFAVLGNTANTSANISTIGGNVGSAAISTTPTNWSFTSGSLEPATTGQALLDLTTARNTIGVPVGGPASLNGTFTAGTYDFGAGLLGATDTITLDGQGSNTAVWIFRFASSLTTVQGSIFNLINVGNGSGVGLYWNVGSSATLGGDTFAGNVMALTSITSDGNLNMSCGRLLANVGKVGLNGVGSTISTGCLGSSGVSGTVASASGSGGLDQVAAIPEPETYAMLLSGLGLMGFVARRRQRNLAAAA